MSFTCVSMSVYLFAHREKKPRSRSHVTPMELHPRWVCVSRWVLSFLTRCKSSTGDVGMDKGWVEGGRRVLLRSFEEGRRALPGLDSCLSMELARLSLLNFTFSSSGFGLFLALFPFLLLLRLWCFFYSFLLLQQVSSSEGWRLSFFHFSSGSPDKAPWTWY